MIRLLGRHASRSTYAKNVSEHRIRAVMPASQCGAAALNSSSISPVGALNVTMFGLTPSDSPRRNFTYETVGGFAFGLIFPVAVLANRRETAADSSAVSSIAFCVRSDKSARTARMSPASSRQAASSSSCTPLLKAVCRSCKGLCPPFSKSALGIPPFIAMTDFSNEISDRARSRSAIISAGASKYSATRLISPISAFFWFSTTRR